MSFNQAMSVVFFTEFDNDIWMLRTAGLRPYVQASEIPNTHVDGSKQEDQSIREVDHHQYSRRIAG